MGKTARIELRAEPEDEDRIRAAARLVNKSLSAFVMTAAVERANEVIASWTTTTVPSEFFDELLEALDDAPQASKALVEAAQARQVARTRQIA
jgi:uncharacterized protein (DUF1778 family)